MLTTGERRIVEYEKVIASAARRFRSAAEYDDLYQEGMIAVWLCPPDAESKYIIESVYNRMKNWSKYIKRLRHYQNVSYDDIMQHEVF